MRHTTRLVLVLLVGLGATAPLYAHAMKATVTVAATEIRVTVGYDSDDDHGGPVAVKLFDAEKQVLGEGQPQPDGSWTFPRPRPGTYRVVASDEFGHRAERVIEVTDSTETKVSAEPDRPRGLMVVIGIGIIGLLTMVGYWFASRKKG